MALLAAGGVPLLEDDRRGADIGNPGGYHEYAPVRSILTDARWLDRARGRAVKIVVPLLRALPEGLPCRVVLMRRELSEVLASQERLLARSGIVSERLAPERLAEALAADLAQARAWLGRRSATAWIEIDYEELVHRPEAPLSELARFARLEGPVERLAAQIRPELHRERHERGAAGRLAAAGLERLSSRSGG